MTLEQALEEYQKKFDDQYPLFCVQTADKEYIIKDIERCIKTGKRFEYKKGCLY